MPHPGRNEMLQVYKKLNKATITVDSALIGENYDFRDHWIHMSNPTDKEIELISRVSGVPEDMIKAALDEEERARVERTTIRAPCSSSPTSPSRKRTTTTTLTPLSPSALSPPTT